MIGLKKSNRKIERIILHCTASKEGVDWSVDSIRKYHKSIGWSDIGYHYVIYRDGTIHEGRPVDNVGAHTSGYNTSSVGVVYVGGVDSNGKAKDTRTDAQREALHWLVDELTKLYPGSTVHGHYEFANKACPSFKMETFWKEHDEIKKGNKQYKCILK